MREPAPGPEAVPPHCSGDRIVAPASDHQRDWWYREAQHPNPDLVIAWQTWIRGTPDVDALRRAAASLVARHESLRTTFAEVDGTPVQVIHAELAGDPLWTADPAGRDEPVELTRLVERERDWRFDLGTGPLIRFGLVTVAPGRALIFLTVHHIVADGWAFDMLYGELCELYERARTGSVAEPVETPRQLREWTRDEQDWNAGPEAAAQLDHWRAQLDGLAPLRPPTDREPSEPLHFVSAERRFTIPRDVSTALRAVARRSRATLFLASLSGFLGFLATVTGRTDVAAVCLVSRRERVAARSVLGCINNVLHIRARVDTDAAGADLIKQVRNTFVTAYAHQDLFVTRVWDAVSLDPAAIDALYIHDELAAAPDRFGSHPTEVYRHPHPRRYARFGPWWENFKIRVEQDGDELVGGVVEYNAELYDAATINRYCAGFVEQLRLLGADAMPATQRRDA